MNEEYTDEQLDSLLGVSSSTFTHYKVITVDNGSDVAGTGATGKFVYKEKVGDTMQKFPYSDEFAGIILASRAQLSDNSKKQTWRTGEFDPLDKKFPITVFQLDQKGRFLRDNDNNPVVQITTYDQLKQARSIRQPDGTVKHSYNYVQIVYVLVEHPEGIKEIIKLSFKGAGRGNFFDYSKALSRMGAKLYNVYTKFTPYLDKSSAKYSVSFSFIADKNNNPMNVSDPEEVRKHRISVAVGFKNNLPSIAAPKEKPYISEGVDVNYDDIPTPGAEIDTPFE